MSTTDDGVLQARGIICFLLTEIYLAPRNANLQRAAHEATERYLATLDDQEIQVLERAAVAKFNESGVAVTSIARADLHSALRSVGTELLELVATKSTAQAT